MENNQEHPYESPARLEEFLMTPRSPIYYMTSTELQASRLQGASSSAPMKKRLVARSSDRGLLAQHTQQDSCAQALKGGVTDALTPPKPSTWASVASDATPVPVFPAQDSESNMSKSSVYSTHRYQPSTPEIVASAPAIAHSPAMLGNRSVEKVSTTLVAAQPAEPPIDKWKQAAEPEEPHRQTTTRSRARWQKVDCDLSAHGGVQVGNEPPGTMGSVFPSKWLGHIPEEHDSRNAPGKATSTATTSSDGVGVWKHSARWKEDSHGASNQNWRREGNEPPPSSSNNTRERRPVAQQAQPPPQPSESRTVSSQNWRRTDNNSLHITSTNVYGRLPGAPRGLGGNNWRKDDSAALTHPRNGYKEPDKESPAFTSSSWRRDDSKA
ncbi:hypothetical protein PMZ80_003805 [Knufia obscura]|uniref:Uncharacterized protein n=2 Tax=Knufia TaxID=430999 RepID=A0AAN8ELZ5_9EURO|nr:hypothetical protein PMZ80_003805 [Knufia obscura]KAK5958278.1 hypothetical protein OHC33_000120 [Knufia fluminis]